MSAVGGGPRVRLFGLLWAPMLVWWFALLPGGMSVDSLSSWRQIVTSRWNNHHPAPFTAFVWLTSLGGTTPATTSLAETALMAACLAALVRSLVGAGAPQRPVTIAAFALGALPLLGPFTVVIWKDIPETALLLLLGAQCISLAVDKQATRVRIAGIAATAFGVALLRWNGGLTDVVAAAVLWFGLTRGRPRTTSIAAIALAAVAGFGVLALIPDVLPVAPATAIDSNAQQLADIGQFAGHVPGAFERSDRQLLGEIAPFRSWRDAGHHSCTSINPVTVQLIDERGNDAIATTLMPRLEKLWRRLALRRPDQLLRAHLCRSILAWLPVDPYAGSNILTVYPYVQTNGFHLHPQGIPALRSIATSYANVSTHLVVQDLFWRPPLWVLALAVLAWLYHRRTGNRRMVATILAIPLGVLVSYVVYPAAQDARYCYAAVVFCQLGTVAYAFLLRERVGRGRTR